MVGDSRSRDLVVACVQWRPGPDPEANLGDMAVRLERAANSGARLVVFPEYSFRHISPPSPEWTEEHTSLDGPWVAALSQRARDCGVVVIAGISETSPTPKPYNTQVVVDGSGVLGWSRKIHLYDAFSTVESELFTPAPKDPATVIRLDGVTIGVQTCYDLRFPEVTRRLVDAGAEVVVVPSQWVPGPHKIDQWRALLIARAIEAQVWVVASDHPEPTGVGASMVIDPRGVVVELAGSGDEIISTAIDTSLVDLVRGNNPMAQARRFVVDWG